MRSLSCLVVLLCAACGAPQRPALAHVTHAHLDAAGRSLVEVDKLYACHEQAAHGAGTCRGKPVSLDDWNAHIEQWNRLRDAIARGYKTILAAEVALQSWEAGDERRWLAAEPCVANALGSVRAALDELDELPEYELTLPPGLSDIEPSPCNCTACEDDFYPYGNALPQKKACTAAVACE